MKRRLRDPPPGRQPSRCPWISIQSSAPGEPRRHPRCPDHLCVARQPRSRTWRRFAADPHHDHHAQATEHALDHDAQHQHAEQIQAQVQAERAAGRAGSWRSRPARTHPARAILWDEAPDLADEGIFELKPDRRAGRAPTNDVDDRVSTRSGSESSSISDHARELQTTAGQTGDSLSQRPRSSAWAAPGSRNGAAAQQQDLGRRCLWRSRHGSRRGA